MGTLKYLSALGERRRTWKIREVHVTCTNGQDLLKKNKIMFFKIYEINFKFNLSEGTKRIQLDQRNLDQEAGMDGK